jgi:electron transfer flavoprotein beta subunit
LRIIVCVKQIPDPETASTLFKIDEAAKEVIPVPGLPMVISPFDEQAVEAALRIKDKADDTTVTVLTIGPESALTILKGALSMGADDGVHLCDAAFEGADSYATALTLSHAIRKIGPHDLILTGRQAADWDAGVVGCGIAELLDIPAVTMARDVRVDGPVVRVERVAGDGVEVVKAPLPAVVTVAHELGKPRKASLRETMRTAQKPVSVWSAADIGLAASEVGEAGSRLTRERLYAPVNNLQCEFIEGETPQQQAANLAQRLHEAGLI